MLPGIEQCWETFLVVTRSKSASIWKEKARDAAECATVLGQASLPGLFLCSISMMQWLRSLPSQAMQLLNPGRSADLLGSFWKFGKKNK